VDSPPPQPPRHRLPNTREGIDHHVVIYSSEVGPDGKTACSVKTDIYLTANPYEDGSLAEVFCSIGQAGSTLSAIVDAWCTAVSKGLQHGIPLEVLVRGEIGKRFEPCGMMPGRSSNPEIPHPASVTDYIARWLLGRFGHETKARVEERARD